MKYTKKYTKARYWVLDDDFPALLKYRKFRKPPLVPGYYFSIKAKSIQSNKTVEVLMTPEEAKIVAERIILGLKWLRMRGYKCTSTKE